MTMTEPRVTTSESSASRPAPERAPRPVVGRGHSSGDRILAAGLSVAACVGLVGLIGWRAVSDAQSAAADALAMEPQVLAPVMDASSSGGLTQEQLDAYSAALAAEKVRLDAYRAQLASAAAQLAAQGSTTARVPRVTIPAAPDLPAASINVRATAPQANTAVQPAAPAAPLGASAPAPAAPPPVARTQGS